MAVFEAESRCSRLVLQHLLVGMNAHIDLDLGIAAAETVGDDDLQPLETDFKKINEILASLVNVVQDELGAVSPFFKFIDKRVGKIDEKFAELGMKFARDHAWEVAENCSALDGQEKATYIANLDQGIARLGRRVMNPGKFADIAIFFIRLLEKKSVAHRIRVLSGGDF